MSRNNSTNSNTSAGAGFTSLLALAFIILKLCHVIDWSWWWVLSPIWISFGLFILIAAAVLIWAALTDRKVTVKRKRGGTDHE